METGDSEEKGAEVVKETKRKKDGKKALSKGPRKRSKITDGAPQVVDNLVEVGSSASASATHPPPAPPLPERLRGRENPSPPPPPPAEMRLAVCRPVPILPGVAVEETGQEESSEGDETEEDGDSDVEDDGDTVGELASGGPRFRPTADRENVAEDGVDALPRLVAMSTTRRGTVIAKRVFHSAPSIAAAVRMPRGASLPTYGRVYVDHFADESDLPVLGVPAVSPAKRRARRMTVRDFVDLHDAVERSLAIEQEGEATVARRTERTGLLPLSEDVEDASGERDDVDDDDSDKDWSEVVQNPVAARRPSGTVPGTDSPRPKRQSIVVATVQRVRMMFDRQTTADAAAAREKRGDGHRI
jgi:hypothetical protein